MAKIQYLVDSATFSGMNLRFPFLELIKGIQQYVSGIYYCQYIWETCRLGKYYLKQ